MKIRKIPRGTFWVGGLAAVALAVPLTTLAVHGLIRELAWGGRDVPLDRIFMTSLAFVGFPAFVTGGGVARLAAHRLAERPEIGVAGAVRRGVLAMAVAGIGLALLGVVPLGILPDRPREWWPVAVVGLVLGVTCGLAVAVLAAMRQRRRAAS